MQTPGSDSPIQGTLTWALARMEEKGYRLKAPVKLSVDPKLRIMGYAKAEGAGHTIVISEWALDSEMLGGLVLHELSHIYFTEQGAHSHDSKLLEAILDEMRENEGLRDRETDCLVEAFNHLQNILADDVVFDILAGRELETAKKFFAEWVSNRSSGDPIVDTSTLCRNSFAIASLKRRGLFTEGGEMDHRNGDLLARLGGQAEDEYRWLESFLEKSSARWGESDYRRELREYFEKMLSMMRSSSKLHDMR